MKHIDNRKSCRFFYLSIFLAFSINSYSENVQQVSQYGITWKFDKKYETGRFVNGDKWVIGPVTIIEITPVNTNGRNGSVVNPVPGSQGYDERAKSYDPIQNIALPININPDASLVSTISSKGKKLPWLQTAAVLTVLSEKPPENSFRPPYIKGEKYLYNLKDVDYKKLPNLILPSKGIKTKYGDFMPENDVPKIKGLEESFKKVWIDHLQSKGGDYRHIRPRDNLPDYSNETCQLISLAGVRLLFGSYHERMPLLIGVVQTAIDYYGVVQAEKCLWPGASGQGNGRKWFVVFLGFILNRDDICKTTMCSGEEQQTYYFDDPSLPKVDHWGFKKRGVPCWSGPKVLWGALAYRNGRLCRDYEHVSPKDWAKIRPGSDLGGCRSERYRRCCTSYSWVGEALSMHLLEAEEYWDRAWFDYVDRWMTESYSSEKCSLLTDVRCNTEDESQRMSFDNSWIKSSHSVFIDAVWDKYRSSLYTVCGDGKCDKPVENTITCPCDCEEKE